MQGHWVILEGVPSSSAHQAHIAGAAWAAAMSHLDHEYIFSQDMIFGDEFNMTDMHLDPFQVRARAARAPLDVLARP